jgi:hypothetical protein
MKKFLLSLTLMLASMAAWAEAGFYVVTNSEEQVGYVFTEEPVWTVEGDNLVITSLKATVEYPMSDIARIYFDEVSEVPSGITEVQNTELIRFVGDGVELTGFAANTVITVYNLQGQQVATYRTGDAGSLNLSLDGLDQGIYIIKANKSTIKIKK